MPDYLWDQGLWDTALWDARLADAGRATFTLSGGAVTLTWSRRIRMSAATGAFTLAGQPVALPKTGARVLLANTAVLTLNGYPATTRAIRRTTAALGTFALSGKPSSLFFVRRIFASSGSMLLTGYTVRLATQRTAMAADTGRFALVGAKPVIETTGKMVDTTPQPGPMGLARRKRDLLSPWQVPVRW